MTPLRLSEGWYRRYYVVGALLGVSIVALYGLHALQLLADFPQNLEVGLLPAVCAAIATITSLVLIFTIKSIPEKLRFIPAFFTYILIVLSIAYLIWQEGAVLSPFITIWTLLAFMAPIFAVYGWLLVFLLIGVLSAFFYLDAQLNAETLIVMLLTTVIPLIAGGVLWRESHDKTNVIADQNTKHLASELSEVAQKSEVVINAIGDGVLAIDGKGTIDLINPAAQEMLGWGKQDALMLHYTSILKLTDETNHALDQTKDPIAQVLNTNQTTRNNRAVLETKTGKHINAAIVASPIGEPGSGAIVVFRDITKERAEEREQAEFISTASHEMRTPVASIEGYLGLALNPNTAQVDERAKGFIMKAHESAQHLGRLFQDLLDVSKSEDGRMTSVPKVVNMAELTETVALGLQQKAQEKGLRLIYKPKENAGQKKVMPVLFVNQDNDHIREILDNLVENAIKYTPEGQVVVDVQGTDDKVIVSVKDSGLGIPAEDLPHLFQKFYRVDNVDRQQIGGTGLGLYLSRRLAEAMQGRLWVESVYRQGSTFYLELPRISSADAESLKIQQASQLAPAAPATAEPRTATVPDLGVVPASTQPQPSAPTPAVPTTTSQSIDGVKPATTVPRGQSLTREQIAERARQLDEMAKAQRASSAPERPQA